MDIAGARALNERIAQQQHWGQAASVQDGRAPGFDPDADTLTETGHELRIYGSSVTTRIVDGAEAVVTRVFCKRLVDGDWVSAVEEHVELAG